MKYSARKKTFELPPCLVLTAVIYYIVKGAERGNK